MRIAIPVAGPFNLMYDSPHEIFFDDDTCVFTLRRDDRVMRLTVEELQDRPFEHPQQRSEADYLLRYINAPRSVVQKSTNRNTLLLLI